MRIKRAVPFFLFVCLLLLGCSKSDPNKQKSATQKIKAPKFKAGLVLGASGLGDQSFNDLHYNGLVEAYRRYNIATATVFPVPQKDDDKYYLPIFKQLIEKEKCNILFACEGYRMAKLVEKIAPSYPNVYFIITDHYKKSKHRNVIATRFAQNEPSFVAGVLAARMTKLKIVCFIGGVNIPVVDDFKVGFKAGVRAINPSIRVLERYCSRLPNFSGFNNPKKGYALAKQAYAAGADILCSVAGASGNGIIQAAKDMKKFVIGVDSNQDHMARGYVLTSIMKRVDVAVHTMIRLIIKGQLKGKNSFLFSYRNGGVSLTEMEYTKKKIPVSVLREVARYEKLIANGKIRVPYKIQK